jgi:hypothetical protein
MLTSLNFDVVKLGKPAKASEDGFVVKADSDLVEGEEAVKV